MSIYHYLLNIIEQRQAGYLVLIDPDKAPAESLPSFIGQSIEAGVDAFLVGGSLLFTPDLDTYLINLKKHSGDTPVILFPGGTQQISKYADAILFLSLLSGRNAQHIIGTQVMAAPIINKLKLEAISTAYFLVQSGKPTTAEFMTGTTPLPRHKPEIAIAHAMAAQYMGFKFVYLEGGSGADHSVPEDMILGLSQTTKIPLIVGGGIKSPEEAAKKVEAGASFIVTGNILERNPDPEFIRSFAAAIHQA